MSNCNRCRTELDPDFYFYAIHYFDSNAGESRINVDWNVCDNCTELLYNIILAFMNKQTTVTMSVDEYCDKYRDRGSYESL